MALWILLSRNLGGLDGEKITSSLHYFLAPTPITFRTPAPPFSGNELCTCRTFSLKNGSEDTFTAIKVLQDPKKVNRPKATACGISTQQV